MCRTKYFVTVQCVKGLLSCGKKDNGKVRFAMN